MDFDLSELPLTACFAMVILGELGCVIDLLVAPPLCVWCISICESTVPCPAAPLVLPLLLKAPPEAPPAEDTTARFV